MAEVLGLVASVIQVAGAGVQLSKALYEYVDGVATADRRIKDIATEIKMTSIVIEELGDVFNNKETASVVSKKAIMTANDTVVECSTLFAQIDATLKKSKKNTFGRLTLPFRDNKLELLRSHIDKLKNTLLLLMQVLTHAYQVASRKLDRAAEARQREEIKKLLEKKDQSTEKHQDLLRKDSASGDSTLVDNGGPEPDSVTTASIVNSTITAQSLAACVNHVRDLLSNIESLQKALASPPPGADHSVHQQSLVESYFRARGHLDQVVLGGSQHQRGALPASSKEERSKSHEIKRGRPEIERERAKKVKEEELLGETRYLLTMEKDEQESQMTVKPSKSPSIQAVTPFRQKTKERKSNATREQTGTDRARRAPKGSCGHASSQRTNYQKDGPPPLLHSQGNTIVARSDNPRRHHNVEQRYQLCDGVPNRTEQARWDSSSSAELWTVITEQPKLYTTREYRPSAVDNTKDAEVDELLKEWTTILQ